MVARKRKAETATLRLAPSPFLCSVFRETRGETVAAQPYPVFERRS